MIRSIAQDSGTNAGVWNGIRSAGMSSDGELERLFNEAKAELRLAQMQGHKEKAANLRAVVEGLRPAHSLSGLSHRPNARNLGQLPAGAFDEIVKPQLKFGLRTLPSGEVVSNNPQVEVCAKDRFELLRNKDIYAQAQQVAYAQTDESIKWQGQMEKAKQNAAVLDAIKAKEKAFVDGKIWPGKNPDYEKMELLIQSAQAGSLDTAYVEKAYKLYSWWNFVWLNRGGGSGVFSVGSGLGLLSHPAHSGYMGTADDKFQSGSISFTADAIKGVNGYPKYGYLWTCKPIENLPPVDSKGEPVRTIAEQCILNARTKAYKAYLDALGVWEQPGKAYNKAAAMYKEAKAKLENATKIEKSFGAKIIAGELAYKKKCAVVASYPWAAQYITTKSDLLYLQWKGVTSAKQGDALAKQAAKGTGGRQKRVDDLAKLALQIASLRQVCEESGKTTAGKAACGQLAAAKKAFKEKAALLAARRGSGQTKGADAKGKRDESNAALIAYDKNKGPENESKVGLGSEAAKARRAAAALNAATYSIVKTLNQNIVWQSAGAAAAAEAAGIPAVELDDVWKEMDENNQGAEDTTPGLDHGGAPGKTISVAGGIPGWAILAAIVAAGVAVGG